MTPADFLRDVATPNVREAHTSPGLRTAFNAILALDALAGIIHAAMGDPPNAPEKERGDEAFKQRLAAKHDAFRLVRDIAAATKHGELRRKPDARLVVRPDAVQAQSFGGGLGMGPISSASISDSTVQVFIERQAGGPLEGVGLVIEAAHAVLSTLVEALPA